MGMMQTRVSWGITKAHRYSRWGGKVNCKYLTDFFSPADWFTIGLGVTALIGTECAEKKE